jgi:hypothetical protein
LRVQKIVRHKQAINFMGVLPYDDAGRLLTAGEVASIKKLAFEFAPVSICQNRRSERFVAEWQGHHLP